MEQRRTKQKVARRPPNQILQLCPHDTAPFDALTHNLRLAADTLGHETTTVFLAPASREPLPGADYLNVTDLNDQRSLVRGLNEYRGREWDLIICHRYRTYRALAGSRLPNSKSVVLAHEYGLLGKWQRRLHRRLFGRDVRFAGVSPPVANELAAVTDQAIVIGNSLDTAGADEALLSREDALAELGLPPGERSREGPIVGLVGRVHYKKRPELAFAAFKRYAAQRGGARLIVVGTGELEQGLRARAGHNVHFAGRVPNAARVYRAFDAVLYPAVADSFGMVPLEALFAGVPVITTDAHGPGFVLGPHGIYVAADTAEGYADGLIAAEAIDRGMLFREGRARIEQRFSIAPLARTVQQLIVEVADEEEVAQGFSA